MEPRKSLEHLSAKPWQGTKHSSFSTDMLVASRGSIRKCSDRNYTCRATLMAGK